MPISMNVDIIIGITLISFGVYTFAKGTSQKISEDIYLKSAHNVSNLVHTATSAHNISNKIKRDTHQNNDQ